MKNNIRVNDIPLNERPIEKLLQFGVNTLSHDELLAIVLRTGTKGENVIELSKRLLWELNGLDGLLDVSYEEVSKIKGIKNTVFLFFIPYCIQISNTRCNTCKDLRYQRCQHINQ